ncbi:MAG: glucokinase [Phenylobacterium zucineum]|nr:MAG: glucokinase [Phenylobacterium zucineum]
MKTRFVGLVGDIGGTNARLALVDTEGHIRHPKTYAAADYASLTEVIAVYLEGLTKGRRLARAALAVAGPVVDGEIAFTNIDWRISEGELVGMFEFETARLLNDFAAQAMAAPMLSVDNLRQIGPDLRGADGAPVVVLGAGTGFGVAGLARSERGDLAISAEGGHAAFAPGDEVEMDVLKILRRKYERVSIERVLSGQGLFELYLAMGEITGLDAPLKDQKAVTTEGLRGDALASLTLDRFLEIYGSAAGDIALTYGARGGVYISGGIAPRLIDRMLSGGFRRRFEAKGRLTDYMIDIPTALIVHPYAALVGAARVLTQMEANPL